MNLVAKDHTQNLTMANQKNDYRGIPTPMCPNCGSNWFKMAVMYDEVSYLPSVYGLEDAECYKCGSLITPATPLDRAPYPPCKICKVEEGLVDGYCWECDPLDEDFL
jgi:hypothetical protein